MTTSEFSVEFDVLYNNVTSNQAPGLNNYEKSVFLTKAEYQLLSEFYNHRTDVNGGYDGNEERQIDFSNIIRTEQLSDLGSPQDYVRIDSRSHIFAIPDDALFILNEFVDVTSQSNNTSLTETLTVSQLSYEEYARLMRKPYKFPPKGQAWRLINGNENSRPYKCLEVIANNLTGNTVSYRIRYVRRPHPIILEDLTSLGVTIDNETSVTECELSEEMHHKILERAVTLAKIAWQGGTATQVAMAAEASRK
jgi:hypothetical protein